VDLSDEEEEDIDETETDDDEYEYAPTIKEVIFNNLFNQDKKI